MTYNTAGAVPGATALPDNTNWFCLLDLRQLRHLWLFSSLGQPDRNFREILVELPLTPRNILQLPPHGADIMEPVLIASYACMLKAHPHDCSVDRILEDPERRNEYLALVRAGAVQRSEYEILRLLHNLRKRSKLPRRSD